MMPNADIWRHLGSLSRFNSYPKTFVSNHFDISILSFSYCHFNLFNPIDYLLDQSEHPVHQICRTQEYTDEYHTIRAYSYGSGGVTTRKWSCIFIKDPFAPKITTYAGSVDLMQLLLSAGPICIRCSFWRERKLFTSVLEWASKAIWRVLGALTTGRVRNGDCIYRLKLQFSLDFRGHFEYSVLQ